MITYQVDKTSPTEALRDAITLLENNPGATVEALKVEPQQMRGAIANLGLSGVYKVSKFESPDFKTWCFVTLRKGG